MKKLLALGAVATIALLGGGCSNKDKKPATNNVTDVAPPAPVHNTVAASPTTLTPAAYTEQMGLRPPVETTTYEPPVTATPATPAPREVTGGPAPVAGKTYTVRKGDTLWAIATRTYGDGKQYKKIVAANPSIKGDKVNAGQTIVLP